MGERAAARRAAHQDLWVSTKCGESDTTSGLRREPTVGNAFDKLYPHGVTLVFGGDDRSSRAASTLVAERAGTKR